MRRLLVIEDDRDIAELVSLHLSELPAEVTLAADGRQGLDLALARGPWDAVLLDLGLPGLNGLDLCRALRAQAAAVPLLMLTARASELDRVLGLELGADDYLTKPFSIVELVARVRALIRRASLGAALPTGPEVMPTTLQAGHLQMDRSQRRARLGGRELTLAPREFDLLWHFARHPGRVFNRNELLDAVWGDSHDGYDHTVNTHIHRLRLKLGEGGGGGAAIQTVWGLGYRFETAA